MFLKNFLFSIIVVVFFFAGAEALLAIAGVRPVLTAEDPFVGFAANIPLFVGEIRPDGMAYVSTAGNKLKLFNYQTFPARKSERSYRVFCMGGSTTFGRPYDDPVSFCGWLRAYLRAADPSRDWEVVNAGGVSYASYRVTRLMQELAQYRPDLFIIYSGQNEFLEQRSYGRLADLPAWLVNLSATLSGTRIYTAMNNAIGAVRADAPAQAGTRYTLGGEVDTILDHTVGPQSYHRDEALKANIQRHYRLNLERMVEIAHAAGAGIVFVRPAINLRDMSPFKSEHRAGLDAPARREWQALYGRAQALEADGKADEALAVYRQALAIDDRYAELHYRVGQVLYGLGRYDAAEQSLQRAVEEDVAPLRILASMQDSVAEVAAAADAPLVDFPAILRDAYRERGAPAVFGREFFVDHVHTNVEGYRLLGAALFDTLVGQGIARPDATWTTARREAVREQVLAKLSPNDEGHALVKLARVFAWAGKFAEAYPLFGQALDILGPRPKLYDQLARAAYATGDEDGAIRHLQALLERFPATTGAHATLAAIFANRGETELAISHCELELLQNPAASDAMLMLGELAERQGDTGEARRRYEQALRFDAGLERARIRLVQLLIRQGDYDAALLHAREAVRHNPDQYQAHIALGRIFMRQGDREQARRHFAEVLRLFPGHTGAQEILRQLDPPVGHAPADKAVTAG